MAKGSVERPEETAVRSLADTIWPTEGRVMCRTGDRGYWNGRGEITFAPPGPAAQAEWVSH